MVKSYLPFWPNSGQCLEILSSKDMIPWSIRTPKSTVSIVLPELNTDYKLSEVYGLFGSSFPYKSITF